MHVNGEPVWMDRHWFPTFLDFLKVNHFKISGIDILNGKIKVRSGQILAIPLQNGSKPVCAYFVKDISRQCEQVDYGDVW